MKNEGHKMPASAASPPSMNSSSNLTLPELFEDKFFCQSSSSSTLGRSSTNPMMIEASVEDFLSQDNVFMSNLIIVKPDQAEHFLFTKNTPGSVNTATPSSALSSRTRSTSSSSSSNNTPLSALSWGTRSRSTSNGTPLSALSTQSYNFSNLTIYNDALYSPNSFGENYNRRSSQDSTTSDITTDFMDYIENNEEKVAAAAATGDESDLQMMMLSEDNIPLAATSSKSRSWKCFMPDCDRVYFTGSGLRYHMRNHHQLRVPIRAIKQLKKMKQTEWTCACAKTYTTYAGLKYHLKISGHCSTRVGEETLSQELLDIPEKEISIAT